MIQSQRTVSRPNHIIKKAERNSQEALVSTQHVNKPQKYKSQENSPKRNSLMNRHKTYRNQNGRYTIHKKNMPFQLIYRIGFGGLGKVWKVQHNSTKETYAMKCMQKKKVLLK